jgi:hypothetical protein
MLLLWTEEIDEFGSYLEDMGSLSLSIENRELALSPSP